MRIGRGQCPTGNHDSCIAKIGTDVDFENLAIVSQQINGLNIRKFLLKGRYDDSTRKIIDKFPIRWDRFAPIEEFKI
ncbi:MAG: hypothetical protein OXH90_03865 [Paracoccaceae bacterium]|nr:hypothetical protein [Paracoccaceae bacterium]MDE2916261.1 hypothetical protein [Paracoccaceae bacterium]